MALTHDELREMARLKAGYFVDRNTPKISTDMMNTTPDVIKQAPVLVDHAVHEAYKIEPGSKVFVANDKMFLKGHVTKKVTIFTREQLVIGSKMKHWLPFEFGENSNTFAGQATPTQLFDLGYYVFETENAKWPHMIVPKSLFEPNDQSMELQAIKVELDKLHTFKKALTQDEENEKNIEALRKHLGYDQSPGGAKEYFEEIAGKDVDQFSKIKEYLSRQMEPEETLDPASLKSGFYWASNDESMGINPDDLGPVIPPLESLTVKQQKGLTKKQVCPDCKHRATLDTLKSWQFQGPKIPASTIDGKSRGELLAEQVYCRNCGSKFEITRYGGFGATRL